MKQKGCVEGYLCAPFAPRISAFSCPRPAQQIESKVDSRMQSLLRLLLACLLLAGPLAPASAAARGVVGTNAPGIDAPRTDAPKSRHDKPEPPQETGFLNRKIELHGATYRFVVYLPEEWRRDDHKLWPIVLFLHGRGERGSEGMWQTQIGLAS